MEDFRKLFGRRAETGLQNFQANPALDAMIQELVELARMGTGLSLDPDGFSKDQHAHFYSRMRELTVNHGSEILEYLKPYSAVSSKAAQQLSGIALTRWEILHSLPKTIEDYTSQNIEEKK